MAKATIEISAALRNTARKIETSRDYQWGNMGACNCGFLAQEITKLRKEEIHFRAMERYGDWNEQLNDYCPTSGLRIDNIISDILAFGFDADDLKHLERLSDPAILKTLPLEDRYLVHNSREDVVKYLRAWAKLIDERIIASVEVELPMEEDCLPVQG